MAQQTEERLSRINELAEEAANTLGLILLTVHLGQQGKNKRVEISIHRKDSPVSFTDCEQMSRSLEKLLDMEEAKEKPVINGSYLLEVVSAGIDRQLKNAFEYNVFAGSRVRITTKEKVASLGNEFLATLLGGDDNSISICQAAPLLKKQKGRYQKNTKNETTMPLDGQKMNLANEQIYRIYLWPESTHGLERA